MKLWILRPVEGLEAGNDPWDPWYDKVFGLVVRADTETAARQLAHAEAGDENRGEFLGRQTAPTTSPWLDSSYSICEELAAAGAPCVVIKDVHWA